MAAMYRLKTLISISAGLADVITRAMTWTKENVTVNKLETSRERSGQSVEKEAVEGNEKLSKESEVKQRQKIVNWKEVMPLEGEDKTQRQEDVKVEKSRKKTEAEGRTPKRNMFSSHIAEYSVGEAVEWLRNFSGLIGRTASRGKYVSRGEIARSAFIALPYEDYSEVINAPTNPAKTAFFEALMDPIQYPEWFTDSDMKPWKTILLYGPPGTATVVFIDEVDSLCRTRCASEDDANRRVKTELLVQMQRLQTTSDVVLVCATNCPWDLDPAFLRRFEKKIYVGLPDLQSRIVMLKARLQNTTMDPSVSMEWIGNVTNGFSGDDIRRFAIELAYTQFRYYKVRSTLKILLILLLYRCYIWFIRSKRNQIFYRCDQNHFLSHRGWGVTPSAWNF
ncbi:unnamed protein product [Angiostrongylus costaricensis]|uniref:ATPase_AAA_core domain-containing protein n=1 Tax=Angiostrongylus costaricensis TaxID=334426 RepID=A0A158PGR5_ANGCS|nr:unnamed protein product [Angiostrongylus costaricensis]